VFSVASSARQADCFLGGTALAGRGTPAIAAGVTDHFTLQLARGMTAASRTRAEAFHVGIREYHTYGDPADRTMCPTSSSMVSPTSWPRHLPTISHQEFARVYFILQARRFPEGEPCRLLIAPVDLRLPKGDDCDQAADTVVQPDVLVIVTSGSSASTGSGSPSGSSRCMGRTHNPYPRTMGRRARQTQKLLPDVRHARISANVQSDSRFRLSCRQHRIGAPECTPQVL
jgi:hypothetical protein